MSGYVKIPRIPCRAYSQGSFSAHHARTREHVHVRMPVPVPVCARDGALCHIPTVRASVRQLWVPTWPYPHCGDLSVLPHREAFVAQRDETMQGSGRRGGASGEVFLGDNVPTVTHERALYVGHSGVARRIKRTARPPPSSPSAMRGTPCPAPPGRCRTPDL